MMASLGGADMIVFTGGIGENDPIVRTAICEDLCWAGVQAAGIAANGPHVIVQVLSSKEGTEIARGVLRGINAANEKS